MKKLILVRIFLAIWIVELWVYISLVPEVSLLLGVLTIVLGVILVPLEAILEAIQRSN